MTAKGGIQAWEVSTGQRSLVIGKADDFAQGYSAITNNGRLLATGKPAGIVTIWDVENLQRWFELPEATSGVWSVAWSPNGQMLAVGQSDGGLSVWRLPQIRNALQSIDLDWTFEQPKPAADKLTLAPSNMNQPSVDEVLIWRRRITRLLQRRRDYRIRAEFGLQFIDAKPEDSMRWLTVAPALVLAGDDAGYAAFCARATSQFSGTQVPIIAENAIKAVLLKANAVDLGKLPAKQFTSSLEGGTVPDLFRPWFWGTRALLAYRSGDAESAVKYIAKSNEHQPKDVARALNLAVLAMAQHQLKDHDKALLALKASSRLITRLNGEQKASHDLLIAEILFREATALLLNEESPSASK